MILLVSEQSSTSSEKRLFAPATSEALVGLVVKRCPSLDFIRDNSVLNL